MGAGTLLRITGVEAGSLKSAIISGGLAGRSADPPSLTALRYDDNLWLTFYANQGTSGPAAAPTNYVAVAGVNSTVAGLRVASRNLAVLTEDPPAWPFTPSGLRTIAGTIVVTPSNVDTTPPNITSGSSPSVREGVKLAHTLTSNETVTWSIVGGDDAARFELSGATLRWAGDGVKSFTAPNDIDANNTYYVVVRATDAAGNATNPAIIVTVLDNSRRAIRYTFAG